jgi:DNA-binding GntR family transcriptional regulator
VSTKWIHSVNGGGCVVRFARMAGSTTRPRAPRPVARRGDTAEAAYVRLREMIVDGAFHPDERLPHARLMKVLRVGRTPLRTALGRLQSDGLVVATPNHGVKVAPAPLGAAEEMWVLRFLVEPPLLEALTPRISDDDLERLSGLLERMRACQDDPEAFQRAHREFHTLERASFASPFHDALVAELYWHLHRHHQTHLVRHRYAEDFIALDAETVAALAARDGARARRALELHLVDAALAFLSDVDADYIPERVVAVARAQGLRIETDEAGRVPMPARVTWLDDGAPLPALRTSRVRYEPPAAARTRRTR